MLFTSKELISWVFSGIGTSVLTGLASTLLCLGVYFHKTRSRRIRKAFEKYDSLYERDGHRLMCLVPSGVHCLKSDREVKKYFQLIMTIEPHHPLRQWKGRVEKIGYKKFFEHVFNSSKTRTGTAREGLLC